MDTELQFQNAMEGDLDKIVTIYNSTIESGMVTADTEPVSVESRLTWFHSHDEKFRPLWVVKQGQATIGWASLQSFYGRPAYRYTAEISIYLDKDFRARGCGKQILAYAMDQCAGLQIKTLMGFIFVHNVPSVRLFLGMGFTEWANLPDIAEIDGKEASLKIFGKRLT